MYGARYSSNDGLSWAKRRFGSAPGGVLSSVAYGNGNFFALYAGGSSGCYSPNGIDWTNKDTGSNLKCSPGAANSIGDIVFTK